MGELVARTDYMDDSTRGASLIDASFVGSLTSQVARNTREKGLANAIATGSADLAAKLDDVGSRLSRVGEQWSRAAEETRKDLLQCVQERLPTGLSDVSQKVRNSLAGGGKGIASNGILGLVSKNDHLQELTGKDAEGFVRMANGHQRSLKAKTDHV